MKKIFLISILLSPFLTQSVAEEADYHKPAPITDTQPKTHTHFHERSESRGNQEPSPTDHLPPFETVHSPQNYFVKHNTPIAQPVTEPQASQLPDQSSVITKTHDVLTDIGADTLIKLPTQTLSSINKITPEIDYDHFQNNAVNWIKKAKTILTYAPDELEDVLKNPAQWALALTSLRNSASNAASGGFIVDQKTLKEVIYYDNRINHRYQALQEYYKDPSLYGSQVFETLLKSITYAQQESKQQLTEALEDYHWYETIVLDLTLKILAPGQNPSIEKLEQASKAIKKLIHQYTLLEKKRKTIKNFDETYEMQILNSKGKYESTPLTNISLPVLQKYQKVIDTALKTVQKTTK